MCRYIERAEREALGDVPQPHPQVRRKALPLAPSPLDAPVVPLRLRSSLDPTKRDSARLIMLVHSSQAPRLSIFFTLRPGKALPMLSGGPILQALEAAAGAIQQERLQRTRERLGSIVLPAAAEGDHAAARHAAAAITKSLQSDQQLSDAGITAIEEVLTNVISREDPQTICENVNAHLPSTPPSEAEGQQSTSTGGTGVQRKRTPDDVDTPDDVEYGTPKKRVRRGVVDLPEKHTRA